MPRRPDRATWALAAILLATLLVYVPTLGHDFTLDDRLVAMGTRDDGTQNPYVGALRAPWDYFTSGWWSGSGRADTLYRPVTVLSYALGHALAGDAVWCARLVNLLLHVGATAMVWVLAGKLTAGILPRAAAAAVFGLHAIHSEAVVGIVGRAELLGFTCGLGAVLLHLRGGWWRGAVALLLFLAFGSKESAVAWAPMLVLVDGIVTRAGWGRVLLRGLLVTGPPLALFLALRASMIAGLDAAADTAWLANPLAHVAWERRIATATLVLVHGMRMCLLPIGLSSDWGPCVLPVLDGLGDWQFLLAVALHGTVWFFALRYARRFPLGLLAAAAFFGFAFVTSNLPFAVGTIFAERLYYAPSLAVALLAAALAQRPRAVWWIAGWLLFSTILLVLRNDDWQDNRTLVLRDAQTQPRSVHLRSNAGALLAQSGEPQRAIAELEAALALDPEHALSWSNLGAVLLEQGRLDDAGRALRRGLDAGHRDVEEDLPALHGLLSRLHRARGELESAADELVTALALRPSSLLSWHRLEQLQREAQRPDAWLIAKLEQAIRARGEDPHWELYHGMLLLRARRYRDAQPMLQRAAELRPGRDGHAPRIEARLALAQCAWGLGERGTAMELLAAVGGDPQALPAQRENARAILEGLPR